MSPESAASTTKPPTGWRAILRIASGIALLMVGILGLLLPVMPGWVFIIPGLMILADYYPPIKRIVDWAKTKLDGVRNKPS